MNKKLIILSILVVVLVGCFVWYNKILISQKQSQKNNTPIVSNFTKTGIDNNKAPEKFPTDIPIESGSKITQNYNVVTPDGRFQATRVFETKNTLSENLSIYKDYLTSAGYKIESMVDNSTYKMIFGKKDNANLQISIDENTLQKVKTVNISYTEQLSR